MHWRINMDKEMLRKREILRSSILCKRRRIMQQVDKLRQQWIPPRCLKHLIRKSKSIITRLSEEVQADYFFVLNQKNLINNKK